MFRLTLVAACLCAFTAAASQPLASPLGAHRGGAGEFPENTVYAYAQGAARWPDMLLEGDLHLSKDGHVVLMHDRTVDRTTNGMGNVRDKTLAELKALDAAHNFTTDRGETHPLRGTGITVPTLAEALAAAPNHQFLFELKDGVGIAEAAVKVIRESGAAQRVLLASFNPLFMNQVRELAPEIRTCFDTQAAMKMLLALRGPTWDDYKPEAHMLTYSPDLGKRLNLKPEELKMLQAKGVLVQLHTLNGVEIMQEYLDLGVDSILTDYPTRLHKLLQAHNP